MGQWWRRSGRVGVPQCRGSHHALLLLKQNTDTQYCKQGRSDKLCRSTRCRRSNPRRYQTNCSPTPGLTSTSAPRASSSCAAAQSPLAAAKCSGERPRWSAGAASRLGSSEGVHASSSSSRLPGEGAERRKDSRGGQSGMQGLQAGTAGGKHNSSIWCS